VRIYLDVSCLNRPFDDQSQPRIRLEAEAVQTILKQIQNGFWTHSSSEMAEIEILAIPDSDRRTRVALLLPEKSAIVRLVPGIWERSAELGTMGFKAADAMHVAAAEAARAGVFLTCDDRLNRCAQRNRRQLRVQVANPLEWLKEVADGNDA